MGTMRRRVCSAPSAIKCELRKNWNFYLGCIAEMEVEEEVVDSSKEGLQYQRPCDLGHGHGQDGHGQNFLSHFFRTRPVNVFFWRTELSVHPQEVSLRQK